MELTLDEQGMHTLFGNHDENLRMIEDTFAVRISSRGNQINVQGSADGVASVERLLGQLQQLIASGYPLKKSDVSTGVRVLRDGGVVSARRRGRVVMYSLTPAPMVTAAVEMLDTAASLAVA